MRKNSPSLLFPCAVKMGGARADVNCIKHVVIKYWTHVIRLFNPPPVLKSTKGCTTCFYFCVLVLDGGGGFFMVYSFLASMLKSFLQVKIR